MCRLAPTLLSISLTKVMNAAFADCNNGVLIQTRSEADLFNESQSKSLRKATPTLVREQRSADDTAVAAHAHQDMQDIVTHLATTAKACDLHTNIHKMEIMYQPSLGSLDTYKHIQVESKDLADVKVLNYFGSTVTYNNRLNAELQLNKLQASHAFGRLKERV